MDETQGGKSLPVGEAAVPDDVWLEDADYEVLLDQYGCLKRNAEFEPYPSRMEVLKLRHTFSALSLEKQIRVLQEYFKTHSDTHRPFCYQGHTIGPITGPMSVITETSEVDWDDADVYDADKWLEEQVALDELTDEELCYFSEYDIGLELYDRLGSERAKAVGLVKDFGGLYPSHRFAAVRFHGSAQELQGRLRQHGISVNVYRVDMETDSSEVLLPPNRLEERNPLEVRAQGPSPTTLEECIELLGQWHMAEKKPSWAHVLHTNYGGAVSWMLWLLYHAPQNLLKVLSTTDPERALEIANWLEHAIQGSSRDIVESKNSKSTIAGRGIVYDETFIKLAKQQLENWNAKKEP